MIPYHDPEKLQFVETNWIALLGALGFLLGVLVTINKPVAHWAEQHGLPHQYGMTIAIGGLALATLASVFAHFRKAAGWELVHARCVDRELRHVGKNEWRWRILCEFRVDGQILRVTPEVHGLMACSSNASAEEFLNGRILAEGSCRLLVNPKNPLQTKLV